MGMFSPETEALRQRLAAQMTHATGQSAGGGITQAKQRMGLLPPWYQTLSGERAGQGFVEALQAINQNRGDMQIGDTSINPIDFVNPVAGIFGGKLAKTADLMALRDAMNRATAGEDARKIWQDTGWFKSPDGQWRFEIDDSGSAFMDRTIPNQYVAADDVMEHRKLYSAYPEVRDIDVMSVPNESGGSYGNNAIRLGNNYDQRSTTLHELQHAIQQREGFARGGSPESAAALGLDETMQYQLARQAYEKTHGLDGGMSADDIYAELTGTARSETHAKPWNELTKREQTEWLQSGRELAYRRLAGEAEARAVQSRMNLTPEQRRMRFPLDDYDVPVDELIMRYGDGPAMSLPMDEASRMQRAQEGGYKKMYHATDNDPMTYQQFDTSDRAMDLTIPNNLGDNIGGFFALNRNHAKDFGKNVRAYGVNLQNPKVFKTQEEFRNFIRENSGRTPDIRDAEGYITKEGVFKHKARKVLEEQGYDGVLIERPNYTKTKKSDQPWAIAFHPSQVRDWERAVFDPAKKSSANLLAGGLLGAFGLNALFGEEQ